MKGEYLLKYRKYWDYHRINNEGIEEKQCQDCKDWFLMNNTYFGSDKGNKDKYNMRCKTCQKIYELAYYDKTRFHQKAKALQNFYDNQEERHRKDLEDYYADKDKHLLQMKNYKNNNMEDWKVYHADYLKRPEVQPNLRKYTQRRQHKNHKISEKEWEQCKKYFIHRCCYCGLKIEEHYFTRLGITKLGDFHKEHYDDDGSIYLDNCVPSCGSCNSQKHKYDFNDWYNPNNPKFDIDRYNRISKWITEDYKLYIEEKKPRKPYTRKTI